MTPRDPALGRFVVITGASSGIGRSLARALAEPGTWLGLVGRRPDALAEVAREVGDLGGSPEILTTDLAMPEQVGRLTERLIGALPGLDVLVHSAGHFTECSPSPADSPEEERAFQVNARAPEALSRGLLPLLRARRGQVVFVNSSVALRESARATAYTRSKEALRAIADALRAEVGRDGIRVLSVYPGRTATPMQEEVHALEGRPYDPSRLLRADDLAAPVVFALALPRTAEITDLAIRSAFPLEPSPAELR